MNLDKRSMFDGVRIVLANALDSLGFASAVIAAAAAPVWLAASFLTDTIGMQPRSAILFTASLELLITVLTLKLWQSRVDRLELCEESRHFETPFPNRGAIFLAILASFLLSSLGALTLFQAHVPGVVGLLAETGVPRFHAPTALSIVTVLAAALARVAAYAALTLAYPRVIQSYERGLRRRLIRREFEFSSDKALEDHRALILRTNAQARDVATAHRTALFERG